MERGICGCDDASDGRPVSRICSAHGLTRSSMSRLVKLARAIDWRFLEQTFGAVYTDKPGQPPLPTADGGASDPQAHLRPLRRRFVRSLVENPYFQYFCARSFSNMRWCSTARR